MQRVTCPKHAVCWRKKNNNNKNERKKRNLISFHLIYPLTARVVRAPQMIRDQFPPFSPVLHCPLGLGELQACPFPDVVFPPLLLLLSALSSSPFWVTCPYNCSLCLCTMVRRSSCGPIACRILARTSSLVTWSLYEVCSILR